MNDEILLEMRNIHKVYPGVVALNDVSFLVGRGEVHALIGENGAGKSTLVKVLSGAVKRDKGRIFFDGREYDNYNPSEAIKMGISVIYQEFNLVPQLSVEENIFLGKEFQSMLFAKKNEMLTAVKEVFNELEIDIIPSMAVRKLSIAYQQLVEIAKALINNAKLIVMDEPSATLTNKELESLFKLIRKLKEKGTSVIYISHRLEEIFEIADRVTVMRDGEYIDTLAVSVTSKKELIRLMVGRELIGYYPPYRMKTCQGIALEANRLTTSKIKDISIKIIKGEILGVSGLVGSGRTELARTIFGLDRYTGEILKDGKVIRIKSPKDAIRNGIGLIPEDRKHQGLFMELAIKNNITISILNKISRFNFISIKKEAKVVDLYFNKMRIKSNSYEKRVKHLSGGNQQKVVLSKWLATKSDILIFDEPTRGIDVGAKYEIYELIDELAKEGKGIMIISSELPELLGICDKIVIMHEGKLVGVLNREEFSQEVILEIASGGGNRND